LAAQQGQQTDGQRSLELSEEHGLSIFLCIDIFVKKLMDDVVFGTFGQRAVQITKPDLASTRLVGVDTFFV
jgi:hypothetical protein